nr:hypothetical protein [Moorella sulfitireducens]
MLPGAVKRLNLQLPQSHPVFGYPPRVRPEMHTHHKFYLGDALEVLEGLPTESVNCCVTSPPYWGLRDYGMEGQVGEEETPEKHVARQEYAPYAGITGARSAAGAGYPAGR